MQADRSHWETRQRSPRRQGSRRVASVSPAPANRGGAGEVAGVRESRHHHDLACLELTVGYRAIQIDRDTGAEQVATLIKGVAMAFLGHLECIAPVAQESTVWMSGYQELCLL